MIAGEFITRYLSYSLLQLCTFASESTVSKNISACLWSRYDFQCDRRSLLNVLYKIPALSEMTLAYADTHKFATSCMLTSYWWCSLSQECLDNTFARHTALWLRLSVTCAMFLLDAGKISYSNAISAFDETERLQFIDEHCL